MVLSGTRKNRQGITVLSQMPPGSSVLADKPGAASLSSARLSILACVEIAIFIDGPGVGRLARCPSKK